MTKQTDLIQDSTKEERMGGRVSLDEQRSTGRLKCLPVAVKVTPDQLAALLAF
jgi:hypothetical protein